jgi:endonuclease/exonuclease/phosphatase family metal-dependent hydrolase
MFSGYGRYESVDTSANIGVQGWDAASVRIVTVGTFVHQASNKTVVGMCTHFDDQGTKARTESAKLILKIIDEATVSTTASRLPVFLGGDFNSNSNQSAYQILNSKDSSIQDAKELAKWRYGNTYTFTGFGTEAAQSIDFVFVGKDGAWDVKGYAVLENKFEDGVYNSDHRAVVGDVVLKV